MNGNGFADSACPASATSTSCLRVVPDDAPADTKSQHHVYAYPFTAPPPSLPNPPPGKPRAVDDPNLLGSSDSAKEEVEWLRAAKHSLRRTEQRSNAATHSNYAPLLESAEEVRTPCLANSTAVCCSSSSVTGQALLASTECSPSSSSQVGLAAACRKLSLLGIANTTDSFDEERASGTAGAEATTNERSSPLANGVESRQISPGSNLRNHSNSSSELFSDADAAKALLCYTDSSPHTASLRNANSTPTDSQPENAAKTQTDRPDKQMQRATGCGPPDAVHRTFCATAENAGADVGRSSSSSSTVRSRSTENRAAGLVDDKRKAGLGRRSEDSKDRSLVEAIGRGEAEDHRPLPQHRRRKQTQHTPLSQRSSSGSSPRPPALSLEAVFSTPIKADSDCSCCVCSHKSPHMSAAAFISKSTPVSPYHHQQAAAASSSAPLHPYLRQQQAISEIACCCCPLSAAGLTPQAPCTRPASPSTEASCSSSNAHELSTAAAKARYERARRRRTTSSACGLATLVIGFSEEGVAREGCQSKSCGEGLKPRTPSAQVGAPAVSDEALVFRMGGGTRGRCSTTVDLAACSSATTAGVTGPCPPHQQQKKQHCGGCRNAVGLLCHPNYQHHHHPHVKRSEEPTHTPIAEHLKSCRAGEARPHNLLTCPVVQQRIERPHATRF